ncbi:MAG TPA: hypothetical protein DCX06_01150 [Opitutae bacterium]|nr:hypothetical protein [Opitutae bacterium]
MNTKITTHILSVILLLLSTSFANAEQSTKKEKNITSNQPIVKTFVTAKEIGPDGSVRDISDEFQNSAILSNLLKQAAAKGLEEDIECSTEITTTGSLTVIGEDGEATTQTTNNLSDLNALIGDALESLNLESDILKYIEVGDPIVLSDCDNTTAIKELKEELASQRKLLEQILQKLN